jgi:hypothetical protein
MKIDWMSLLVVAGVTIAAAAAVVGIFSLGLAALSAGARQGHRSNGLQRAGAYACFAAVVLIVIYGLYLIIPQFH